MYTYINELMIRKLQGQAIYCYWLHNQVHNKLLFLNKSLRTIYSNSMIILTL